MAEEQVGYSSHSDKVLHVLDLPQLYQKPSEASLLDTLRLLSLQPPSWEEQSIQQAQNVSRLSVQRSTSVSPEGLTRYLTGIIASQLSWIDDENAREDIWEQASLRLSERSGRSAMPALSRSFRIPTASDSFDILLHEPALTADNLGLKTWAASYLLAKRLHKLKLPPVPQNESDYILELGSGTGLVGIAAAAIFGTTVCLTDLPEIEPNLRRNCIANGDTVSRYGGRAVSYVLDWMEPEKLQSTSDMDEKASIELPRFQQIRPRVIFAADSIYSSSHPRLLAQTVSARLSTEPGSMFVVELPIRDAYLQELDDFRAQLNHVGLELVDEGNEVGFDDWGWNGEPDAQLQEVRCWWSIWARVSNS